MKQFANDLSTTSKNKAKNAPVAHQDRARNRAKVSAENSTIFQWDMALTP
jgi:hypothetical protein